MELSSFERHQKQLLALEVITVNPEYPRKGFFEEDVMLALWRELLAQAPYGDDPYVPIERILHTLPATPDQRILSVATSFVVWLGTTVGMNFYLECLRAASECKMDYGFPYQNVFLSIWAAKNRRQHGCNHGFRSIEFILALPSDYGPTMHSKHELARLPELSALDYETVEGMVLWLSSVEGKRFMANAGEMIDAKRLELSNQRLQKMYEQREQGDA